MTPSATTPAARKATPQHRRARQPTRPAPPRRVSGPVRGRAATAPAAAPPRRSTRPSRAIALRTRVAAFVRSLPDHVLLDRLIRGRSWIPVLGVMLAGIVAMQVEVLKLGASIGRSLERNSVLSSRNASLRQSVATLGDDQRIEQLAASMGMVMAPPQAVGFLAARGDGNAPRAVANIRQPSSSSFLSVTPGNGAVVTATLLANANAPTGATGSTSTIASTPTATPSATASTTAASTSTAVTPAATAPTVPSAAAGSTAATPTTVTPTQTSSSAAPSSSQATPQSQASTPASGPSTGAAGIGPPSANSGGG